MDLLATYLVEAEELLAAIEEITLDLGPNSDPEQLNSLFRAFRRPSASPRLLTSLTTWNQPCSAHEKARSSSRLR